MKKGKNKKARPEPRRRVIVAMSGGIDSSVAAALLNKDGFDVMGVFMKFWSEAGKDKLENSCCTLDSEKRARQVAKILKIPFYVFNFEKEFKKKVVDYFLKEYKTGRTPNPCVVCNKEIKFGLLLEKALALDADFVATGHYAQKQYNKKQKNYKLLQGKDKEKDQSYFLWQLSKERLKRILFPVGGLTKLEVRKLVQKFKLPVSNIPESQEICFVPADINDFLTRHLKQTSGNIVDAKEKILGTHNGLAFYTIGQRKGINLSGGPFYVSGKDLMKNHLIISKQEKDLLRKDLVMRNINWISGKEPKLPAKISAKIRYRHDASPAVVSRIPKSKIYSLKFKTPQRAITPGQSAVFYNGRELLGGGTII